MGDYGAERNNLSFSHLQVSLITRFDFYISNIFSSELNDFLHALLYICSKYNCSIRCGPHVDYYAQMDNISFSHLKVSFMTNCQGKDLENYYNHKADSLHAIV